MWNFSEIPTDGGSSFSIGSIPIRNLYRFSVEEMYIFVWTFIFKIVFIQIILKVKSVILAISLLYHPAFGWLTCKIVKMKGVRALDNSVIFVSFPLFNSSKHNNRKYQRFIINFNFHTSNSDIRFFWTYLLFLCNVERSLSFLTRPITVILYLRWVRVLETTVEVGLQVRRVQLQEQVLHNAYLEVKSRSEIIIEIRIHL